MDNYYTIKEAAKKIGVSAETLRRWDKSGKFTSQRHPMNQYRVYSEDQLSNLVEDMQITLHYVKQSDTLDIAPRFQTDLGKLYKIDAIEFLSSLEDNSARIIFADPPYNIKKAEWDTFKSQKAYVEWSMEWIKQAHRGLHPTGSLYICGFSEILADLKWASSSLFEGCKWLIWFYRNKANLGKDWGRSHESILHFRKSRNHTFNIDEVRIPYNQHTLKYPNHPQAKTSQYGNGKDYAWKPHPNGAKPKDVFDIPTIANKSWERYNHPTQKPVELLKKFILASSHEGELVIDPFGGSGTTYAVAEAFNRKWMGSELNEEYCQTIAGRLSDEKHIKRIFSGKDEKAGRERRVKLKD